MARALADIVSDIALTASDIKNLEAQITANEQQRRELYAAKNRLATEFNSTLIEMYPAIAGSMQS